MKQKYIVGTALVLCMAWGYSIAQSQGTGWTSNSVVHQGKMVAISYDGNAGESASMYEKDNPASSTYRIPSFAKVGRNVGTNIRVNDPALPLPNGLVGRSETIIATDPSGQYLLTGWNDSEGFCGAPFGAPCPAPAVPGLSGYGWSTDGGTTWTDGGAPPTHAEGGLTWITRGDPWFDTGGPGEKTYYYANLTVPYADPSPAPTFLQGILIHRGTFVNDVYTWNNSTLIMPTNGGLDAYDKESLAAGKSAATKDMVAVVVTNFMERLGIPYFGYGQIECFTSTDQAATFPTRGIVQPDETNPNGTGVVNQGAAAAIGEEGNIYVTWERGTYYPWTGTAVFPQIVFAKSTDGGATFSPRTLVSAISSATFYPPVGYNRPQTNDFPRIAYDPKYRNDDNSRGRLYIAYQDSRIANGGPQAVVLNDGNGNTDVYLRYSTDQGATWSAATMIAGGAPAQFWPSVSVQSDGTVDVVWQSNDDGYTDTYYAGSSDGGATFSTPMLVTPAPTYWPGVVSNIRPNFGDYIGSASTTNRTFALWGDGHPDNTPNATFAPIAWGTPKEGSQTAASAVSMTLDQNYPNPFNPSTNIGFSLNNDALVTLKVYNAMGQEVAELVNGNLPMGHHSYQFDADNLAGGAYLYKLVAGNHTDVKTMMLIK